MSAAERKLWEELRAQMQEVGTWASTDARAVKACCQIIVRKEKMQKFIDRHGVHYETGGLNGVQLKKRPEVDVLLNLMRMEQSYLIQFGLTAVSRSRAKFQKKRVSGIETRQR